MITQKVEEVTSIKTGAEMTSIYDISAQNFTNCASNRMYVKLPVTSLTASNAFTACIPLKAPCTYLVNVKMSVLSDTGGQWVYWAPYRMTQTVSGGAVSIFTPLPALINDPPGTNVFAFSKTPGFDSVDLLVVANVGGSVFNIVLGLEIFCNKNF